MRHVLRCNSRVKAGLLAGLVVSVVSAPASGLDVEIVRLDGASVRGSWKPMEDAVSLSIMTGDGPLRVPLDDVAKVSFGAQGSASQTTTAPYGPMAFQLADGGRLRGRLVGGEGETVVADTLLGKEMRLSFDRLAAIQFAESSLPRAAADLFDSALRDRRQGLDALITRDAEEPKLLHGRIEKLDSERGSFVFNEETRTFPLDKAFGVVFAVGTRRTGDYRTTATFDDGSTVAAHLAGASDSELHLNAATGHTVSVPLGRVRVLQYRSDRVVFLSDLPRGLETLDSRVQRPASPRNDRNIGGGPLVIGGRSFDRGLGFRSGTRLSYDINGAFETFVATVGIDDHVRPRGRVAFRVHGDDSVLFDSGLLTGSDGPRDIVVNVSSVQRLTLEVDYGDDLDISDYGDWGGARLLKPRKK